MEREKKLFVNSAVLLAGSILTKGLNFLMAPLFTRWLERESYGTFDLLMTYATLLIPLLALGVHHALFRFLLDSKTPVEREKIVTNSLMINLMGTVVYFVTTCVICCISQHLSYYILLLSGLLVSQSLHNYMGMYMRGDKQIKQFTVVNVLCTVSVIFFVCLFVKILKMGLPGMTLGYVLGYLVCVVYAINKTKIYRYIRITSYDTVLMKKMLKYALPMIPNSVAWWLVSVSDRMIVSVALGVSANAILAAAHKIPNLCTMIFDVFHTAWVESATEAINDSDWNDYFGKMINMMGQFCISVSLIVISTNFFLFEILFPKEYEIGKYLVPIFAVAMLFLSMGQCLGSVFVATYDSKKQGGTMIAAGIVNIIVHLLLISYIGLYASAVSTLVAYLFLMVIRYISIKRKYDIKITAKTVILFVILICYVGAAYFVSDVMSIVLLVISIAVAFYANKDIIRPIVRKYVLRR